MQHPGRVIVEYWPDLLAAREPGTRPRIHAVAGPIADAIRERDRIERAERSTLARGAAPAPAQVHVLDVIRDVTNAVLYVEDQARDALALTPYAAPPTPEATVPSACRRIDRYISLLSPTQAEWCTDQLRPAAQAVLSALHLDERPLTLLQPCPSCGGPLTVYAVHLVGPHVLCSGTTNCGADASTWLYGRPLWRWDDLARLGAQLHVPARPRRVLHVNLRKAA